MLAEESSGWLFLIISRLRVGWIKIIEFMAHTDLQDLIFFFYVGFKSMYYQDVAEVLSFSSQLQIQTESLLVFFFFIEFSKIIMMIYNLWKYNVPISEAITVAWGLWDWLIKSEWHYCHGFTKRCWLKRGDFENKNQPLAKAEYVDSCCSWINISQSPVLLLSLTHILLPKYSI